jgi:acetylornithine deacetylase/succinyl-diaminopimelate desuccinylase-like protein
MRGETMTIDPKSVLTRIDADELVKVTLDLANLDSPTGSEGPVADYVHDWLQREGFDTRKVALFPDRPNVLATLPGTGHGRSLCFNSHMDTTIHKDEWWTTRRAADPIFHAGWREGDVLVGNGVCNCKGPMATWLLAAKAIKDGKIKLKGDLMLMAVVGEIGLEPVDEFQPPAYLAKEAGTRYAITHGGVADFALVSEGTDFGIVGVEAGKAFFKITVFGDDLPIYTPYIQRPVPLERNASAIVRMSKMIQAVEAWAVEYERKNRYDCSGGTVVPKVNIGAIRGGVPWKITKTVQQCAIYVDVRITPIQEPLDVREQLQRLMAEAGLQGEVELYVFRPAFEADEKKAAPLRQAITNAHRFIVGAEPKTAPVPTSSMWRDLNCFNEMRIPSLTYGPGVSVGGGIFRMPVETLITGTKLYVMTALDLCNQERRQ